MGSFVSFFNTRLVQTCRYAASLTQHRVEFPVSGGVQPSAVRVRSFQQFVKRRMDFFGIKGGSGHNCPPFADARRGTTFPAAPAGVIPAQTAAHASIMTRRRS